MTKINDRIHIDVDNEEWGRVASDATIIGKVIGGYIVAVDSIKANIVISKKEARNT